MSEEPITSGPEPEATEPADVRRQRFLDNAVGEPIVIANEFAEIRVVCVQTRNGTRLLIGSPKSGQWNTLDPLELEALTWQGPATFSAMVGHPFESLLREIP
ncbi:hypothetical protein [Streptomyces albipurpureus]|uniref:Dihydrodiol dehydrogenase n=1 Tax=Streptomyces albipurpureus TaxID=2897419 RepID=A0ABT0UN67_9ACTN|nr:hypothetical protein [Streptomyces sp. CWNU-1]MCM2389439.1 hypothetical protein [Streptomyces sp. CWNU-1]